MDKDLPKGQRAIYKEMQLTPAMIRSIRTLCPNCLHRFIDAKAFTIVSVPSVSRAKDVCTFCQVRQGYDYVVVPRPDRRVHHEAV